MDCVVPFGQSADVCMKRRTKVSLTSHFEVLCTNNRTKIHCLAPIGGHLYEESYKQAVNRWKLDFCMNNRMKWP